ncbi:MAG: hypothetical protein IH585_19430 [Anaerolineaceae bacterium]|nr:hypothetical protein [Anaerolineaceae bacterium]
MQPLSKIILIGLGKVVREVLNLLQACDLNFEITALSDSSACLVGQPLSTEMINTAIQSKATGQKLADLPEVQPLPSLEKYFTINTIIIDTSAARESGLEHSLTEWL